MLTSKELAKVEGLTPEQISAIEILSKNDEDKVIHDKTSDWYAKWDADILEASGIPKTHHGERSFDYAKRAFNEKNKEIEAAKEFKEKLEAQKQEIKTLKAQINEGKGDEAIRQQLKDAQSELESLKTLHKTEVESWKAKLTEKDESIKTNAFKAELDRTKVELKDSFDDKTVKEAREALIERLDNKILQDYKIDFAGSDGKTVVLRDKDGEIVRNPDNLNEPLTIADIYKKELSPILKPERQPVNGTGTTKVKETTPADVPFRVTAKTRVEADAEIMDYLISKGEKRGTSEFSNKITEIRKANNVEKLPVR